MKKIRISIKHNWEVILMTIAICIACVFICIWLDDNKKEQKRREKNKIKQ